MRKEQNELLLEDEFSSYTAVDVETPNRYARSICSIGIVHVEPDRDPAFLHTLVDPEDAFDAANIGIHGIRPEDVEGEPTLKTLWRELEPYFSGGLLIAHNALFDLPVMKKALLRHGVSSGAWRYVCTLEKSRRHIPKQAFGSHRLDALCAGLGIPLEHHHNALDDAIACANLFEHLKNHYGCAAREIRVYR